MRSTLGRVGNEERRVDSSTVELANASISLELGSGPVDNSSLREEKSLSMRLERINLSMNPFIMLLVSRLELSIRIGNSSSIFQTFQALRSSTQAH